jgi:hypothetical protein
MVGRGQTGLNGRQNLLMFACPINMRAGGQCEATSVLTLILDKYHLSCDFPMR